MIFRANGPVASPAPPRPPLALSPPRSLPLVEAPPFGEVFEDPPTCDPAVGGWMVGAFLGHPASSTAPASKQAIVIIRFMKFSPSKDIYLDPKPTGECRYCVIVRPF